MPNPATGISSSAGGLVRQYLSASRYWLLTGPWSDGRVWVGRGPDTGPIPESGPPQSVSHYRPGRETTHGDQPRDTIVSIKQPVTGDSV